MSTGYKISIAAGLLLIGSIVVYLAFFRTGGTTDRRDRIELDSNRTVALPDSPAGANVSDPALTPRETDPPADINDLLSRTEPAQLIRLGDDQPIDDPAPVLEIRQSLDGGQISEPDGPLEDEPDEPTEPGDSPTADAPLDGQPQAADSSEPARLDVLPAIDRDTEPGLVIGRETADDSPQTAAQAPGTITSYTVRENDSMWKIAVKLYGDGSKMVDIAKANPMVDPQRIKPGDVLRLPEPVKTSRGPVRNSVAEPTESDPLGLGLNRDVRTVRVLANDSLWKIADREYGDGTKWELIYNANRDKLKSPDTVREGMELVLPPLNE